MWRIKRFVKALFDYPGLKKALASADWLEVLRGKNRFYYAIEMIALERQERQLRILAKQEGE